MKKILSKIGTHLKFLISPSFWVHLPKNSVVYTKKAFVISFIFMSFFCLLIIYFIHVIFSFLESIPLVGILFKKLHVLWKKTFGRFVPRIIEMLENTRTFEVKRSYLIYLAFENLRVRKSRSLVTVAGMSFGVGVIVLLLSLGYGVERLVIGRVASLNDLQVIDVSTGGNTAVKLTQDAIRKFQQFAKVESAIPLVSVVGRITYNKASTDVLVYSAPNEYFSFVNAKLERGSYFKNNKLSLGRTGGDVAGASTNFAAARLGQAITGDQIAFNINPDEAAAVWDTCSAGGTVLGFTTRIDGGYKGKMFWGSEYYPYEGDAKAAYDERQDMFLGKWTRGVVALYNKNPDGSMRPKFDESGVHKWVDGCVQARFVQVGQSVLGASTQRSVLAASESASLTASSSADFGFENSSESADFGFDALVVGTSSAGVETVDLSTQQISGKKETEILAFKGGHSGEAVVSSGLLNLLNISMSKAVGTVFDTSFIIGKSQIAELDGKAFSEEKEYKIIGVIDDPEAQYFYIPLQDAKNLGITNFSQTKIVLEVKDEMKKVRKQIEDLGFRTASTADTVAQIETLFGNLRIVLGLLGMVALGVASLGMFNTLTVSLLERTREIGGMKTIGMVTDEVQELLLAEAMIMGLSGGMGGLLLGFLVGKMLSLGVSVVALSNGQGFLDLTYIPPFLVLFIILSSFVVGVITGMYPAIRARRVSALNALRYE